ncbi:SPW repeat protein [Streptomyces sp. NPDC048825]|uniref:SPW repeat protein n=1 Tax=Streptomyces sp. NPDC048825 TaxID=3365592 RepID=UPI003712054B
MTSPRAWSTMESHPDLVEMRQRPERAATLRAQVIQVMAVLTGLYLAASPWILGFNGGGLPRLVITNLIVGIGYALLMSGGFGRAYDRTHSMAWAACALAAGTVVAPWVVAGNVDTTRTIVSNLITGLIALLLALAASTGASPPPRTR